MHELVTVVLPVYNVEKYLNRCVESVVAQTYNNLEIILVDDGSTDNCPVICDEWSKKDNRIKVIHKTNAGLGMARNTGIDNANGKYIFFFDSDDSIENTLVEKCVASANTENSDVVIFSRTNIYDDGKTVHKKITAPAHKFDKESITNMLLPAMLTYKMGFGVSAWSKMYNLDIIKSLDIRFKSERELISEDAYFALELYPKLSVVTIVDECLYNYYIRSGSLSRSHKKDRQQKNDDFLNISLNYAECNNLPESVINSIMSRYQTLTLSTMLQIIGSDLPDKQKKHEVYNILKSSAFKSTLKDDVINLSASEPRVFYKLIKYKLYLLCYILLFIKAR